MRWNAEFFRRIHVIFWAQRSHHGSGDSNFVELNENRSRSKRPMSARRETGEVSLTATKGQVFGQFRGAVTAKNAAKCQQVP